MKTKGLFKTMMVALCCLTTFAMVSCDDDDDTPSNTLKLSKTKTEVAVGKTDTVKIGNGTSPYTIVSGDVKITTATLFKTDSIVITGVKQGKAIVTVTDKNGYNGKIIVTVKATTSGLTFDKTSLSIENGKEGTITIKSGSAPYTVVSKDASIATASISGSKITIKGVKAGSTTVTVTDKNKKTGTIVVTVKAASSSLEFDKTSVSINAGKEDAVTVKNGTAPYTATSKDTSIATVSVSGSKITIKGVKAGSTTVTVTDKNKLSSTLTVTIK